MTKYAEVIYEPGSKSVMSFESEDELKAALKNHNDRAMQGKPGASQDQTERGDIDYTDPGMVHPNTAMQRPAERVTKVYTYDNHPADFRSDGKVGTDAIKQLVDGMADGDGKVDANQLVEALRDELSPTYPSDQGKHESMYKISGTPLDLSFLTTSEGGGE